MQQSTDQQQALHVAAAMLICASSHPKYNAALPAPSEPLAGQPHISASIVSQDTLLPHTTAQQAARRRASAICMQLQGRTGAAQPSRTAARVGVSRQLQTRFLVQQRHTAQLCAVPAQKQPLTISAALQQIKAELHQARRKGLQTELDIIADLLRARPAWLRPFPLVWAWEWLVDPRIHSLGRGDLVLCNAKQDRFLVVELKRKKRGNKLIAQMQAYCAHLQKQLPLVKVDCAAVSGGELVEYRAASRPGLPGLSLTSLPSKQTRSALVVASRFSREGVSIVAFDLEQVVLQQRLMWPTNFWHGDSTQAELNAMAVALQHLLSNTEAARAVRGRSLSWYIGTFGSARAVQQAKSGSCKTAGYTAAISRVLQLEARVASQLAVQVHWGHRTIKAACMRLAGAVNVHAVAPAHLATCKRLAVAQYAELSSAAQTETGLLD